MLLCFILLMFIGGIHLINWLITKGVILVVNSLWQIDWRNEFWAVYLGLIILGILINGIKLKIS